MPAKNILQEMENRMKKTIEMIRSEFSAIRTGKASPALVENITINYYDTPTKLKELAGISTPDAKLIVIQPWDPTISGDIEKAIQKSDLGITPSSDGKVLRLPIPDMSEERRIELTKHIKRMAEEGKISIRNIRRDANDAIRKLEKEKQIPEDDRFKNEKIIQDKTEDYIKKVDELLTHKERELMEV